MTDEVARLVLRNNYQQTLALSLGAAARAGGPRLPAAADADAGNARAARPRGGIPARRDGDRRAAQAQSGADAAGAGGAAGLCQALALQRAARQRGAGRSLSRARARALFPQGNVGALRRRAARASAAARDHRHATDQFDDQPRRRHADRAHRRPDRRRRRGDRRRFRRRAQQLRPDRAQQRDRRARQQSVGRDAARALCRRAGSAARPAGLVPAQCRSQAGAGEDHRALPRRHRAGGGRAR